MAKVLISLPDDLLDRIDREAESRGDTRSDFLREAARQALGWPDAAVVSAALDRGRAAMASVGAFESSDLIAETRRTRDVGDRRRR
jgi:predicted transcriptional regulator